MNALHILQKTGKRLAVISLAAVLLFTTSSPVYAGGHGFGGGRVFIGGRGFLGGLAFGVGMGLGQRIFYTPPRYYPEPNVVVYANPTPIYYVQPPSPQSVTVVTAPATPGPAIQSARAPITASAGGKLSKILYDANAKPVGVLVLNNDGTQEFVPLAQ